MPPQTKVVEVAAAVLLRTSAHGTPEYLLACRPEGKVYADYWEFPGGKLEAGENVRQALVRELQEEMGITVTAATPWLHKQFVYPHATVHLSFWRVTAWTGEIGITAPLEHREIAWLPLADALQAEQHRHPILPANGPILKGLALPTEHWITQAGAVGINNELARLRRALAATPRAEDPPPSLIQIREPLLSVCERQSFASEVITLAKPHRVRCLLNITQDTDWAMAEVLREKQGLDGIHLPGRLLEQQNQRPQFSWVGASCHTVQARRHAEQLDLDYALVSPVLHTQSHPETQPLGWEGFSSLIQDNRIPVLALGGLQRKDLSIAQQHGAHGIALMRGW